MIGIYKITNPSNKIYVGQSINIKKRFVNYKCLNCKGQIKLFNSFNKYGIKNHIFEILHLCEIEDLNKLERYYQDLYEVIGKYGLNLKLTDTLDKCGTLSQETKNKMSLTKKGTPLTENHRNSLKLNRLLNKRHHSFETRNKMKLSRNKTVLTDEWKQNIGISKSKKVIDLSTNIIYNSATEVCNIFNIKKSTLNNYLKNNRPNKTSFKYVIL